jgi:hypothetical protein
VHGDTVAHRGGLCRAYHTDDRHFTSTDDLTQQVLACIA